MGMPVITPGTVTREEAVGNIIESVAMEESALSHVLNAEGEKLQAAANMPGITPQELLAVNESVQNSLEAISRLELMLHAKLRIFQSTICE